MAITDSQIKQLIIDTVGDVDTRGNPYPDPPTDGVIATNIDVIWESHAGLSSTLQQEYSKLDAIDLVLSKVWSQVDTTIDTLKVAKSQRARALLRLREMVVARIQAIAAGRALMGGAGIGNIAAIEPKYPKSDQEFLNEIRH